MYYIVGSGPAGIACAHALTSAGRRVTILDGGAALEPEREAIRAAAALRPRAEWTEPEITVLRTVVPGSGDVPQKLVHGSDYPYRRPAGAPDIRYGKLHSHERVLDLRAEIDFERRTFLQEILDDQPLAADRLYPTASRIERGRVFQLEKMFHDYHKSAAQFTAG